jgi:uncharacterized protein YunC (DUF1805 family)
VIAHSLGIPVDEVFLVGSGDQDLENELDARGICGVSRRRGHPLDPEDSIVISLAGMFAEVLLLDARTPNADDFASEIFQDDQRNIDRSLNLVLWNFSKPMNEQFARVMNRAMERTKNLVLDNERNIRKMSSVLLRERHLDADAIVRLLGERTLDTMMSAEQEEDLIRAADAAMENAGMVGSRVTNQRAA